MTICIATNLYYPSIGGVPNYYWYLAQNLSQCGHTVIVLKPDYTVEDKDDIVETTNGITVVTLCNTYNKHYHHLKNFFRPGDYEAYSWIAMGYAMKEWMVENRQTHKIDIIEVPDYGGLGIFLKNDLLPPVLVGGHSALLQLKAYNYIPRNDHTKVLQQLERLSFNYADGIVAHSPQNKEDLATILQKDIYFARAPWIAPRIPPTAGRIKGLNIVVSGLHFFKGPVEMAEAIRILVKKEPGFKLSWIGGDTYSAPRGEKVSSYLAREYADIWGTNFTWEGPLQHNAILAKTAMAETAFIPSQWETFNYFALESAYLSTPLIMTDKTGSEYLFREMPSVKIVAAGSPLTLAEAYHGFRNDNHPARTDEVRKKLTEYFSPDKIVSDRMSIYNELIQNNKLDAARALEELKFLDNYFTSSRKTYYFLRRKIKSLILKPKH